MKKKISIYPIILLGFALTLTYSCTKDDNKGGSPPPPPFTVTDVEGNVYHTVTIGTQVWMVENLNTTKFRNGDPIPNVTDDDEWGDLATGACCNYDNIAANSTTYGKLYNWYAVTDSRNIAPAGWHVPGDVEWKTLITHLGGDDVAGGKLKESGTSHWFDPNTGATNETGFTALPGGVRRIDGVFFLVGYDGYWWTSTEQSTAGAWIQGAYYNKNSTYRNSPYKKAGYSVRCIMD